MKALLSYPWIVGIGSAVIGGFIVLMFWDKIVSLWRHIYARLVSGVPRQTLRIVADVSNNHWTSGTIYDQPCIHVSAHMIVTNTTNLPVRIVKASLDEHNVESPVVIAKSSLQTL